MNRTENKLDKNNLDVIEILHDFMHEIGHVIEFSNLLINHMCCEYKKLNFKELNEYSLIELKFEMNLFTP